MGEFTNVVNAISWYLNDGTIDPVVSTFSGTDYQTLKLSNKSTEVDIVKSQTLGSGIGSELINGKFNLNTTGVYLFQLGFTFLGTNSNNYVIRATLNENQIDQTVVDFTTRGNQVRWEVSMNFIVDIGLNTTNFNNGFYSTKNTVQTQAKNVSGTNQSLSIVTGNYNITKLI